MTKKSLVLAAAAGLPFIAGPALAQADAPLIPREKSFVIPPPKYIEAPAKERQSGVTETGVMPNGTPASPPAVGVSLPPSTAKIPSSANESVAHRSAECSSATAEEPTCSPPEPDLVVNGRRMSGTEYRDQVKTFLKETGVVVGERSAARWVQPACPRVVGLSRKQAMRVELKLREIARDAGVPLAGKGCKTNVAVAFTDDAGRVVSTIQKRSWSRLAEVPSSQRQDLLNADAPVRWWYTTTKLDRFGMSSGVMGPHVKSDQVAEIPGVHHSTMALFNSSIVSTQIIRALQTATVVVDVKKASGVSLETLASYAALVAFAEINARDAAPPRSILGLLTTGGAADLTDLDRAFLRSLYGIALDREAYAQRNSLLGGMMRQFREQK